MNTGDEKRLALFERFVECVNSELSFLEGMSCPLDKSNSGWSVKYSNDKVIVSISHTTFCEMDLSISLRGKPGYSVFIEEIVTLVRKKSADKESGKSGKSGIIRQYGFAVNDEQVEDAIKEFKELLLQYCGAFLEGEEEGFNEIMARREEDRKEYEKRQAQRICEEQASKAWKSEDFSRVVSLYESMLEDLTPVQNKKLQIARKRVGSLRGRE